MKWQRAFLGVVGVALFATSAAYAVPKQSEIVDDGFTFCVSRAAPLAKDASLDPALATAVLLGVTPADEAKLRRTLSDANTRWEARANPLTEDLEDGEPDDALERWLVQSTGGATALAAGRTTACATDGFCVTVRPNSSSCERGTPATGAALERARFLAWPYGRAIRIDTHDASRARALATALRQKGGAIALVVTADDEARLEREHHELRASFARHEVLRRVAHARDDDHDSPPEEQHPLPLHVGPTEVLVLPKLSAVAEPNRLDAEVRTAL